MFFWSIVSRIRTEYRDSLCNLHIQSECGKIRNRKTQNTNMFYAVCDNIDEFMSSEDQLYISRFLIWNSKGDLKIFSRVVLWRAAFFESFSICLFRFRYIFCYIFQDRVMFGYSKIPIQTSLLKLRYADLMDAVSMFKLVCTVFSFWAIKNRRNSKKYFWVVC